MKNKKTIITFICLAGIMTQFLFFPTIAIFGNKYEGRDQSSSYIIFLFTLLFLILSIYLFHVLRKGINKSEISVLSVILLIFFIDILHKIYDTVFPEDPYNYLATFILLGLPGIFSAFLVWRFKIIHNIIVFTMPLGAFLGVSIVLSTIVSFIQGEIQVDIGGTTYQFLSYISAFSFGLLTYKSTYFNTRSFYINNFSVKLTFIFLTVSSAIACILGGGRGAFILLIIYIIKYSYSFLVGSNSKRINSTLITSKLILIFFIAFLLFSFLIQNEEFSNGLKRATQFISGEKIIDLEAGGSGRDSVYKRSSDAIEIYPFSGYGPFDVWNKVVPPHNIILEILLQFGIPLGTFVIVTLTFFIYKIYRDTSEDIRWIKHVLIFPCVMLFFSGSYLHNSIFLFSLTYFYLINKNRQ